MIELDELKKHQLSLVYQASLMSWMMLDSGHRSVLIASDRSDPVHRSGPVRSGIRRAESRAGGAPCPVHWFCHSCLTPGHLFSQTRSDLKKARVMKSTESRVFQRPFCGSVAAQAAFSGAAGRNRCYGLVILGGS